jgi:hypothetical protein
LREEAKTIGVDGEVLTQIDSISMSPSTEVAQERLAALQNSSVGLETQIQGVNTAIRTSKLKKRTPKPMPKKVVKK